MAAFRVSAPRLRPLLRLRARLAVGQLARDPGRRAVLILGLLVLGPLILFAAAATLYGYRTLPPRWSAQLLALLLVAFWLAWLALPLLALDLNERMDVTRLLLYPLAPRELAAALFLGTLFDFPTYLLLPFLLAILLGWGSGAALILVVPALLLGYGQLVFGGQLLLAAAGGVLGSRRFRDQVAVLLALLAASFFLLYSLLGDVATTFLGQMELLPLLRWLPPGAVAQAIVGAAAGAWPAALGWLLYAGGWTWLLGWLWWRLTLRLVTGHGFLLARPAGRAAMAGARRRAFPAGGSPQLRALVAKELALAWRTPQRRVILLQGILLPLLLVGLLFFSGGLPRRLPPWLGLTLPFFALFSAWTLSQNGLGWEGRALATLLLLPVPRARLLRVKGAVMGAAGALPILALGAVLFWLAPAGPTLAGLLAALATIPVVLAATAAGAVLFPLSVHLDEIRLYARTGGRARDELGAVLLVPLLSGLLSLPLALPLILAFRGQTATAVALGGLGLGYGLLLFWLGTAWAGRVLLRREAEVIQATALAE